MFDQRPPAFIRTFDIRCVNVPFALERLPVCLKYLNGMRLCRLLMSHFVSVLTAVAHMTAAKYACNDSDHCSLERLAPFVGDVYSSKTALAGCKIADLYDSSPVLSAGGGLHRALHLRSYKQEVIIMVSDVQRLDSFLQAADSLQQLGLSNILLLSYSKDMCDVIDPIVPDIGCAWSSHKHPADLQGNFHVWSLRYRILAR